MNKIVILCLVLCLLGLGMVSETEGKFLSFYILNIGNMFHEKR